MKKLIAVFMSFAVFTCLFSSAVSAAAPTLTAVLPSSAKTGDSFDVEVHLSNNPGFNGLQIAAEYDKTVLSLEKYENGDIFKTLLTTSQNKQVVPYEVMWITSDVDFADVTENGKIITFTFKVLNGTVTKDTNLKFSVISFSDSADTKDYDFKNCEVKIEKRKASSNTVYFRPENIDSSSSFAGSTSSQTTANGTNSTSVKSSDDSSLSGVNSETDSAFSNNTSAVATSDSVDNEEKPTLKENLTEDHRDIFYPIVAAVMSVTVISVIFAVIIIKKHK